MKGIRNSRKMEVWQFGLIVLLGFGVDLIESSDFYSLTVEDLKGNAVPMSVFKGKVLLIVNVASECGYTDKHYKELVELQTKFDNHDFNILAFPCNQFGQQEPLRNSGIARFVKNKYNVNFPVFSKIKVVGPGAHPLYKYLYASAKYAPQWNFAKYLVNRAGKVIQFWSQHYSPLDLENFIDKHVNMAITDEYEVYNVYKEL